MPLTKSTGNMYPWVDYCHSHLRGRCPHECTYCYVQHMRCKRFYQGPVTLKESELKQNYGSGNVIFIEHMSDMFAEGVPDDFVDEILNHCEEYKNKYVFQTKNPESAFFCLDGSQFERWGAFPSMVGTTIETNRKELLSGLSKAPSPLRRWKGIMELGNNMDTFITIEPVMKFDPKVLGEMIVEANPVFVNIGADSKKCGLPEPTPKDINTLLDILDSARIEVREKHNLDRLMKNEDG